jgi:hypothetical protein
MLSGFKVKQPEAAWCTRLMVDSVRFFPYLVFHRPRSGGGPHTNFLRRCQSISGRLLMAYTYDQLSKMNVTKLREIAQDVQHDAVHGFSTMHKEKLLPALCIALGIEAHKHHAPPKGINKAEVKLQIRALKKKRDALVPKDYPEEFRKILREIHHLKNRLRSALK